MKKTIENIGLNINKYLGSLDMHEEFDEQHSKTPALGSQIDNFVPCVTTGKPKSKSNTRRSAS